MKKITLFAVAALAASTASAARPVSSFVPFMQRSAFDGSLRSGSRIDAVKSLSTRADAKLSLGSITDGRRNIPMATTDEIPGEGEGPVTIENVARFRSPNAAFYVGMSPNFYSLRKPFGLMGIRNIIGFTNLTEGADGFKWEYDYILGYDKDQNEITAPAEPSETRNLQIPINPLLNFKAPVLKADFAGDTVEANIDVVEYMAGMSTYQWGIYAGKMPAEGEEQTVDIYSIYGVYNCAAPLDGTPLEDYTLDRDFTPQAPAEGAEEPKPWEIYNTEGVNGLWDYFYGGAAKEEGWIPGNIRLAGYTNVIPQQLSAYQLGHMWMYAISTCTKEAVLTASIYEIDAEGAYDTTNPIGRATCTLPKGDYPANPETDNMLIFEFQALEDGMALNYPPSISGPVAVVLTGFDNPDIRYFAPVYNANTTAPKNSPEDLQSQMWPLHTLIDLEMDVTIPATETEEEIKDVLPLTVATPLVYTLQDGSEYYPSDMLMFFNVEFPVSFNPADGKSEFNVEAPVDGGTASIDVIADYDLQALLNDEMATIRTVGADWFTFTTETATVKDDNGDDFPSFRVNVTAQPLPKDTEGRMGYIAYKGYGCDLAIVVTQGTVAGINGITAADKPAEFFDLQGRRLSAAPAKGIYIERRGTKAAKRLAL